MGRVAAAAKVGDQWGCRKTASIPGATLGRPAAVSPRARSGVTRRPKHARTVGNQSAVRKLLWLVRRHCVESSAPVRLYADSHGAGHVPPSLLRAVFSNVNRPQRTLRLAPPPATVSRSLEQHPARTSGAVTPAGFFRAMWRPPPASRSAGAPQHSTTDTGWPCFSSRLPAARQPTPCYVMHFVLRWANQSRCRKRVSWQE